MVLGMAGLSENSSADLLDNWKAFQKEQSWDECWVMMTAALMA